MIDNQQTEIYDENKSAYIELKRHQLFIEVFEKIVNLVFDFNNRFAIYYNDFIMIKGGASVEYHLNEHNDKLIEKNIERPNILTSDIDMLFISKNDNYVSMFDCFMFMLGKQFNTLKVETLNGLTKIFINDIHIIDITIYDDKELFDDDSMVNYASKNLGYSDFHVYITKMFSTIESSRLFDDEQDDIDIMLKQISFTSFIFEYYATKKGIEITNYHINNIENWKIQYNNFPDKTHPLAIMLSRQIKPNFIQKIVDKSKRYQIKLDLLKELI